MTEAEVDVEVDCVFDAPWVKPGPAICAFSTVLCAGLWWCSLQSELMQVELLLAELLLVEPISDFSYALGHQLYTSFPFT